MIPLRYENGKPYIGKLEVVVYPIGPIWNINLADDSVPPMPIEKALLAQLFPNLTSENPALLRANCYDAGTAT